MTQEEKSNPEVSEKALGDGFYPEQKKTEINENTDKKEPSKKEEENSGKTDDKLKGDDKKELEEKEDKTDVTELFGKPDTGYDYKDIKLPDGMELNKDSTEKLNIIAEKYNMSQKGANDLMTLAVELTQQTQAKMEQAFAQAWEKRVEGFKEAINKDPDIGGAKLKETFEIANIAYSKFSDDKIQNVLQEAGLNNHPEVVKMFYNIGKLIKDDEIRDANKPSKQFQSIKEIMYPEMHNNVKEKE